MLRLEVTQEGKFCGANQSRYNAPYGVPQTKTH